MGSESRARLQASPEGATERGLDARDEAQRVGRLRRQLRRERRDRDGDDLLGRCAIRALHLGCIRRPRGGRADGTSFIAEVPFFGVPLGKPLTLTVSLLTRCRSGFGFYENGGAWQSVADVYFDRTLGFATDYVATLPAEVTLDFVAGGIADNVWTPVPEPSAQLLYLAAAAVLARIARAHRRGRR